MRTLTSLTKAELKDTALAYMREEGRIEGMYAGREVARRLDSDPYNDEALELGPLDNTGYMGARNMRAERAREKYFSRVKRALEELVADGLLIKVGRGGRTPEGRHLGNTVYYYTPEQYAQDQRAAADRQQIAVATTARWTIIEERLFRGPGVVLDPKRAGGLTLSHWEQLLQKGGW